VKCNACCYPPKRPFVFSISWNTFDYLLKYMSALSP
jgi:hypothetical protein